MRGDGALELVAPTLGRLDAPEQGALHDLGAAANPDLLEAVFLAPEVGLDVVEPREKHLELEERPGRSLPSSGAQQLTVAGEEPRIDRIRLAEDAETLGEAA